MRRFLTGFMVAAVTAVVPALALAGNQEVAEQIANRLTQSGRLGVHDKIGVKYQDGTAWLRGHVSSTEQEEIALRLAFQTPGVGRVVNELTVSSEAEQAARAPAANPVPPAPNTTPAGYNPLRDRDAAPAAAKAPQQPQQVGLVERLQAALTGGSEQPKPLPARDTAARADRVPSSYAPANVERTAAEEPQELPRQTAVPVQTAMMQPMQPGMQPGVQPGVQPGMQPMVRGPVAPNGGPMPMYSPANSYAGVAPARYDQPCLPNYAWPSYAAYPNYACVTYPRQYSPTAWPYIGPFYPYPQVPLGWRKVTLEWDDGWWFLDFKDQPSSCWHR